MATVTTEYDRQKEAARERIAQMSLSGRDIGKPPRVAKPYRKRKARRNFRQFCDSYFPQTFSLTWSPDHLKVIAKIEQAVLHGGLFAMAMPRGSGKTTLAECACIWSVLYGHREFVALIGSSESHATDMLDSIKTELDGNELLLEDFPEVVYPIAQLEGIVNRCRGQLCRGKRTHISWTAKEIVLPTITKSVASGAIIKVAGITGRIRGLKHKRRDGTPLRPTLVILDDPQTDESARSLSQCAVRESILAGAILGLAGPGKKISGIMPCTVIRSGDMADSILDRDKHPEWNGERTKMIYAFPTDEKRWNTYAEIRAECLRRGDRLDKATQFYREHKDEMDAGAEVAWPERFNHDELSAIQHAMNLRLQDEAAFCAEYQNEPVKDDDGDAAELTVPDIITRLNRHGHRVIPAECDTLTAFVDVQANLLYYAVVAWSQRFSGHIVDYGAYPEQKRQYFTLRDATRTLGRAFPGRGLEAAIFAGLEAIIGELAGREWRRDDGAVMRLQRCMIDANWGQSTDVVYLFCRQSEHANIIVPSHGRFIGASGRPLAEYKRRPGDRVGQNWIVVASKSRRSVRHCTYDTNYWKTFLASRLSTPIGDPGSLMLFGAKQERHRMIAEHITSEFRVRTEGRGRTVDEWKLRPGRDNHLLDCLVGSAVTASMEGVTLFEAMKPQPKGKRVSFRELQRRKKDGR